MIAGGISIAVFKSSLKQQNKKTVQLEYNKLMKFLEVYKRIIYPIKNNLGLIDEHIKNQSYEEIENLVELNFQMFKDLKQIDTSEINYRTLRLVNLINRDIELILFQLLFAIVAKDEEQKSVNLEAFAATFEESNKLIADLEQYEHELGESV